MRTAVIYARYSSDSQSEQSIEGQLRVCEDYAKRNDILILGTYIDRAMTGTNDNRPDFQRMIKDSARREWSVILVYKLDRFSRDKYATAINKNILKNNGVKVISAMENIPDTPEGIILESLLEGMNQYYSAELAQKIRRGMRETRIKGNYQGGGLTYGYRIEGRKIVIDEAKAEVVRYMFVEFSKGVYVRDIIMHLAEKGILYRNKPFAMNTVYNILKNEKYTGRYYCKDDLIENMYPRIISDELFNAVRKLMKSNKTGKRSLKAVYLLRHKLICGYCGRPISSDTGTAKNGEIVRYYKCFGRKHDKNGCQKSIIRKDRLEELVINEIVKALSEPHIVNQTVDELLAIQEKQAQVNTILAMLSREKRQTDTAIENLVSAIEQGVITNTTAKRLKELEAKQEQLERQILIEKSKSAVKFTPKEIKEYYEQALRLEPQMLINYLIKQIVLFDGRMEIYFNSPLQTSPDSDSQGFSFYRHSIILHDTRITIEMFIIP